MDHLVEDQLLASSLDPLMDPSVVDHPEVEQEEALTAGTFL